MLHALHKFTTFIENLAHRIPSFHKVSKSKWKEKRRDFTKGKQKDREIKRTNSTSRLPSSAHIFFYPFLTLDEPLDNFMMQTPASKRRKEPPHGPTKEQPCTSKTQSHCKSNNTLEYFMPRWTALPL